MMAFTIPQIIGIESSVIARLALPELEELFDAAYAAVGQIDPEFLPGKDQFGNFNWTEIYQHLIDRRDERDTELGGLLLTLQRVEIAWKRRRKK
ncbi:MAG: hypothetical protein WC752_02235 [Patescibacteria group bacterium]